MGTKSLTMTLAVILTVMSLSGCGWLPTRNNEPSQSESGAIKIGVLVEAKNDGTPSFCGLVHDALGDAKEEFAGQAEFIERVYGVSEESAEQILRQMCDDGCVLILAMGSVFTESVEELAARLSEPKFCLVDGFIPDLKKSANISCVTFKEHEGSFLMGVVAALKSNTGKVGFIGGLKSQVSEGYEAGFHAGVKSVDPTTTVLVGYLGNSENVLSDPEKAFELASDFCSSGADVLYHITGKASPGVFEAAAKHKSVVIAADCDESLVVKPEFRSLILTSMLKRVDVAMLETISVFMEGFWEGGYREFGLADGGMDYATNEYNEESIKEYRKALEDNKNRVSKGDIVVPANNEELKTFLCRKTD